MKKPIATLTGNFRKPFTTPKIPGKECTIFTCGINEFFLILEPGQAVPAEIECTAVFACDQVNLVQNGKVAGFLKPCSLVKIEK